MIKFGTSGFRGVIGDNYTKENVQKVAYAIANEMTTTDKKKTFFAVGYDTRFMGDFFAKWFSEVLVAYGIKVKFFNVPTPSPLIAFETKNACFGAHITASHNPYYYNGIKLFQTLGRETTTEQNAKLEKVANQVEYKNIKTINFEEAVEKGKIILTDNIKPYCNSILNLVNRKSINLNIKLLFNSMGGGATVCANYIFKKLGIKFEIMNQEVNPNFNFKSPMPCKKLLTDQSKRIKNSDFNLGIAVDGDGDRINIIDEKGDYYDCNYLSSLIYDNFLENHKKGSNLVKNCASTSLLDIIAEKHNCEIKLAKVGFKNTAVELINDKKALMGMESNGIAIKKHVLHKDGLATTILLLASLKGKKVSISTLIRKLKKKYNYPCEILEFAYPFTPKERKEINKKVFVSKEVPKFSERIVEKDYRDGAKFIFKNKYWAVIRFSGNENVLRLFVEQKDVETAEKFIKVMENFVGLKIRQ